jgi:hypothetical protein
MLARQTVEDRGKCCMVLASDQRGPVECRTARTRAEAFVLARRLLDQAEHREWHRGEAVSVRVEQAEE